MVGQEGPGPRRLLSGDQPAPRSPHIHHTLHRAACTPAANEVLGKIFDYRYRLDMGHSVLVADNRFR